MKRASKVFLAGALAASLVAGCSSASQPNPSKENSPAASSGGAQADPERTKLPVGKAEVVFWEPDLATWQPTYKKLEKEFEAIYPDIDVKIVNVPQDAYFEKLNAAFAGDRGPDVWVGWYSIDEYKRGYMEPLDEYIKADNVDVNQYFQPIADLRGKGTDGKRYGLPRDISMIALVYNKDLFDKYGVAYPKDGWTLDDFRETAKKLTHKEDKVYGTDLINDKTLPGSPLIWNMGGDMISEDGYTAKGYLDGEPMQKAFKFFQDVMADGSNIPDDVMDTLPKGKDNPGFASGTVAMSRLELWGYSSLNDVPFKWGVVSFPKETASGESYGWVDTVNFHMNAKSAHKNEAWAWLKFLTGKKAASIVAAEKTWIPAIKEVWSENGWDKDEKLGVFYAEGNKKTKISVRLRSNMYKLAINTSYKKAFTDSIKPLDGNPVDPAVSLKQAAEEAQAIIDKEKQ
ncbi:sugar ABC transporter substrate-binding protein [Brevibacillus sp. SYP-B805]|uniref:ABC transporter substrate-binding protein n=1 Tax=Brevibacillus sp. SYP-B805 TaxID=1578199 RepID=UPI0013EC196C|nr:sugar ABC transporter substrate-binding protein [Brevibacillus sp. SYP-B805]NGQ95863.1 sugar ABC transporter substrate-binding protein [Brevibacillus sp. SYP-B805]